MEDNFFLFFNILDYNSFFMDFQMSLFAAENQILCNQNTFKKRHWWAWFVAQLQGSGTPSAIMAHLHKKNELCPEFIVVCV